VNGTDKPSGPTILVVDDEDHIRELVTLYLSREGYRVAQAETGEDALRALEAARPDLIVLDIMLPGKSGWEVCRYVKDAGGPPIIMLTALDESADKVLGLELGADDYVSKPFDPRELVARVKSVLRRARRSPETPGRLDFARFAIDRRSRELEVEGTVVPCPSKEFELLWLLASNPRRVFSREELLQRVWGYDYYGGLRTVDVHIRRLRKKVEPDPGNPRLIITVWGAGYRFDPPETKGT